jgi:hypothetical protein
MPWDRSRPVDPKYRSPEHRAARKNYKQQLDRDGYLICAQPVCVKPSRIIHADDRWCAGHDDSGTVYIGPVHWDCNNHDATVRGNQNRHKGKRWAL